jgi:hypothetical protein
VRNIFKIRPWSRTGKLTAIVLTAAIVCTVSSAVPAGAATTYRLVDWQTGYCLDSNSTGSVYTLPCNGGNNQNWIVTIAPNNNGALVFQDAQTRSCLYDFYIKSGLYGVRTAPCNGNAPWQQYSDTTSHGHDNFLNNYSRYCLDSNYGSAYETPCNGGTWQAWALS